MLSRISRNAIPNIKPAAAGIHAALPISADCSMDGISRLHTEAAVITPAAKPISALRTEIWNSFFIKKHTPLPEMFPGTVSGYLLLFLPSYYVPLSAAIS